MSGENTIQHLRKRNSAVWQSYTAGAQNTAEWQESQNREIAKRQQHGITDAALTRKIELVRENIAQEWPEDADGFPHRQAARVLIINPDNQTYLIRGHDYGDDAHCWWFTVGGGICPGEDFRQAAARELREETGLKIEPARLEGPVLFREATFYFALETRKQDEYFFILRVTHAEQQQIDAGIGRELTDLEQEVLEKAYWFTPDQLSEIETQGELVYPLGLAKMLANWVEGWDGKLLCVVEDK